MTKSVIVFGGSSEAGQKLTAKLAALEHQVINVDHNKSEVEGVTRYPFDLGSHQIKGILSVANPQVVISCERANDGVQSQLEFLGRLCDVMIHAQSHDIGQVVVLSQDNTVNQVIDAINQLTPQTKIHIVTDLDSVVEDFLND